MTKPLFATFDITGQIFHSSKLSLGVVNLKPLVPGHVLVIPKRVVARYGSLTEEECVDLALMTRKVSSVIESVYKAESLTIACQDGPLAGQSVPHVHFHIIPRHKADFEPLDSIYDELAKASRTTFTPDADRVARSKEEMRLEAEMLSGYF